MLRVLSVLFFNHLSLLAQEEMSIPVIPEDTNTQQLKNKEAIESVEDPSAKNANQEVVKAPVIPGSSASPRSFLDIAQQISSAQVEHYGGEAGSIRVRLRGARAFEPDYYFNGLPLTGANSGEQNLSLLPFSLIGNLVVYPDAPPFWLNSHGAAGDIDIKTCRRKDCFSFGNSSDINLFKVTGRGGSFGYRQALANYSLKIKKIEFFSAAELTASKENYPVFNNHNSILNSGSGRYENLQNNDFEKLTAGAGLFTFYAPLGKISFDSAFGNENRGIPGPVGTISNERMKRNLFIGTLRSEKVFAASGLQWNNQIGALYSRAQVDNLAGLNSSTYAAQSSVSEGYTLQVKSWFILPSSLLSHEQTGFSAEVLQQRHRSTSVIPGASDLQNSLEVQAQRTEFRPTFFEALIFPISDNFSVSANGQGWISYVQTGAPVTGYTFSLQSKTYALVHFVRYVQTARRPYLNEIYGSTGGIIANSSLQAESSQKIETGISLPFVETGYFFARDKNLIFLQQTSPVTSQYQNIENGHRQGAYLNSSFVLFRHWNFNFSYQYLLAEMERNNLVTEIPRSPKHYFTGSTALEKIPVGHFFQYQGEMGGYINMTYESPFYIDYANITQMKIPTLYNTGIAFSLLNRSKSQAYVVSLDVYNIFNETFSTIYGSNGFVQQVQSNGYLGYPPPGRRIYLSFTGEF